MRSYVPELWLCTPILFIIDDKMAGSQSPENAEVIQSPPNVISTYTKKISQLVLRMQYPDSIKVASGNLDNVLKEINRVSGEMLA